MSVFVPLSVGPVSIANNATLADVSGLSANWLANTDRLWEACLVVTLPAGGGGLRFNVRTPGNATRRTISLGGGWSVTKDNDATVFPPIIAPLNTETQQSNAAEWDPSDGGTFVLTLYVRGFRPAGGGTLPFAIQAAQIRPSALPTVIERDSYLWHEG